MKEKRHSSKGLKRVCKESIEIKFGKINCLCMYRCVCVCVHAQYTQVRKYVCMSVYVYIFMDRRNSLTEVSFSVINIVRCSSNYFISLGLISLYGVTA